ncbi:MAG: hypothetical protein AB7F64_06865 [Gammaproteobacteria bacterium]
MNTIKSYKNTEYGSALITALLIMVLVSVLAYGIHQRLSFSIHRTESLIKLIQLENLNTGLIAWVDDILSQTNLPKQFPLKIRLNTDSGISLTGTLNPIQTVNKNSLSEPFLNVLITLFPELSHNNQSNQEYFLLISSTTGYNHYTILKRMQHGNITNINVIGSF